MTHQIQMLAIVPSLSTLLEHLDFQDGWQNGYYAFQAGIFDGNHSNVWNEEDIIQFVEEGLSVKQYEREQRIALAMGWTSPSYLSHLGYLDQAIARKSE